MKSCGFIEWNQVDILNGTCKRGLPITVSTIKLRLSFDLRLTFQFFTANFLHQHSNVKYKYTQNKVYSLALIS